MSKQTNTNQRNLGDKTKESKNGAVAQSGRALG